MVFFSKNNLQQMNIDKFVVMSVSYLCFFHYDPDSPYAEPSRLSSC